MSAILRKYGEATTVVLPLIDAGTADHAVSGDYTHAAGDTKISKDEGAAAQERRHQEVLLQTHQGQYLLVMNSSRFINSLARETYAADDASNSLLSFVSKDGSLS